MAEIKVSELPTASSFEDEDYTMIVQNNTTKKISKENMYGNYKYSTDEIVTGKWIDDKPIYRKVIIANDIMPEYDNYKNIDLNINNLEEITDLKCIAYNGDTYFNFDNYTWYVEEEGVKYWNTVHVFAGNSSEPVIIIVYEGRSYIYWVDSVKFIIEYTKTTD